MRIKVIKNVDINELDFSVRTWNCLRRAKIDTVQDIADNYHNLNQVRNLGIRCIAEINEKIVPYVEFVDKVRITHYDRIRNMSIDEMESFFKALSECDMCSCDNCVCYSKKAKTCVTGYTREWLESEVNDSEN